MSTIKVDNLQTTGGAGLYPARTWVNFNGTGTVAVRGDGNLSSITDNGTGDYTLNLTTAMSNSNYSAVGSTNAYNSNILNSLSLVSPHSYATGSVDILTGYPSNNVNGIIWDLEVVNVAIIG